jgi:hypothetical protein
VIDRDNKGNEGMIDIMTTVKWIGASHGLILSEVFELKSDGHDSLDHLD